MGGGCGDPPSPDDVLLLICKLNEGICAPSSPSNAEVEAKLLLVNDDVVDPGGDARVGEEAFVVAVVFAGFRCC
jgi:hypothetical protein